MAVDVLSEEHDEIVCDCGTIHAVGLKEDRIIDALDAAAGSPVWVKDEDGTLLVPLSLDDKPRFVTDSTGHTRCSSHPNARRLGYGGWWVPVEVES